MTWTPDGEPLSAGIGDRSVLRLTERETSTTVELRGPAAALEQLADLVQAGQAAVDRRMRELQGGLVGYHLVLLIQGGGMDTLAINVPAPGIRTLADLAKVQAEISAGLKRDVAIMSWREIEIPPQIEVAKAVPAGLRPPANLVS